MFNRRSLAALNAGTFTGAQISLVPLFPFLAERAGLSLSHILAAFAAGSAIFVWGSPFWAKRSDSVGRARVLLLGTLGLSVSTSILLFLAVGPKLIPAFALALLALSRLIYGGFASAVAPVAQAWQSDLHTEGEQNAAMTLHSLALSAGRLVALLAVVALAQTPSLILVLSLALSLLLVGLNTKSAGIPPSSRAISAPNHARPSLLLVWPIFALAFLFTGSVELVNSSLSGTLQYVFALDAAAAARFVGQLLLGASAVVLVTQGLARRVLRRTWRTPLVVGLLCLLAGATLLGSAQARAQVWAALALISVALGLIPPAYLSALSGSAAAKAGRGKAAGLLASTQTLGYAAGAGLAAWSFHFYNGDRAPALSLIVMLTLSAGFVLLFRRPNVRGSA